GLLQRTPRGRIVTDKAYTHLGISGSTRNVDERLLF
ncbi:MAG TPA: Holliday junction branch migration DNA helicase RuvB, partial [Treponema sp.]|nr:Holliday junction branch migration DNA helicase RuvB [Treponema sp.]